MQTPSTQVLGINISFLGDEPLGEDPTRRSNILNIERFTEGLKMFHKSQEKMSVNFII